MNTHTTKPPAGLDAGARAPSRRKRLLGVAVELSAIIAICVILIAAVDGFGG